MTPPLPKVALLVGGLGTRLQSVLPSTAKPMATVGDRPFLELLLRQLASQGFRRVVLCTGYRSGDIESQLGDGRQLELQIEYSQESSPLGTAGALKLAERCLQDSDDFLVMNGDSFMELNIQEFLALHRQFGGIATLAAIRLGDPSRYGTVAVDVHSRITGFFEKTTQAPRDGLINAGVYAFRSAIFDQIPSGQVSLEREVFPKLLSAGFYAVEQRGIFIDIGTPEDYRRAQSIVERLYGAALRSGDLGNSPTD